GADAGGGQGREEEQGDRPELKHSIMRSAHYSLHRSGAEPTTRTRQGPVISMFFMTHAPGSVAAGAKLPFQLQALDITGSDSRPERRRGRSGSPAPRTPVRSGPPSSAQAADCGHVGCPAASEATLAPQGSKAKRCSEGAYRRVSESENARLP